MSLQDREWFWEGYEERYGFNKKENKPSMDKAVKVKQVSESAVYYCKRCNASINVKVPKKDIGPFLQYGFKCPYCGKKNSVGNDTTGIWPVIVIIGTILLFILLKVLGN